MLRPRVVALAAGDVLLREGENSGYMYLLQQGRLEVLRAAHDGTQVELGTIGPGELVGEISLLDGTPHTATVRAHTPCVLLALGRNVLDEFDPEHSTPLEVMLVDMARSLAVHLRRSHNLSVAVLSRELEQSRMRNAMASFIVVLMLGFAAYAVAMKYLSAARIALSHSTLVTGPILAVMAGLAVMWIRRSGLPRAVFGLTWTNARRHAIEAILWSLPMLAVLTLGKWALVELSPDHAGRPVIPLLHRPFAVGPLVAYLVYAALVPVQELLARGAIQGALYEFLGGSPRQRWFWAIVVSNTLFAVTHLHLTLVYGAAAFVGGVLWGILYARQRSLVGPVVSHVIVGVFTLYVLGYAEVLKGIT
ncbi:cyclic nucleotide-binding domain-containing protein [Paraliomyxa miuraensis]|uniref:cyclic nucleotide-binding domain-containing protein n=1 Tax=Paraliomyxa miuraensis TaxID=376150 RepID=UPI0022597585|nr:cyclic nucleotide-binding domain-containing protein [Paraliomyxa miuraensis]MCX4242730.1 cyclic nucleotide-binding domain-containing protein [Paraliomyxa miuraensis]